MIVKKIAYEKTGGFNETITNIVYPDDTEFAIRFQNNNFDLVFKKDFRVISSSRRIGRSSPRNHIRRVTLCIGYLLRYSKRFRFLQKNEH